MRKIISILLILALALTLAACGSTSDSGDETESETAAANTDTSPVVIKIDVKDFGTMTLELYPDIAPITVANFLSYVDDGFYNGLTFHRIYKGFMIQGGDPKGNGTGDGGKPPIKGEFAANGVENNLSHTYGVISMARTKVMDSATCQFFICNADASASLDGMYAAFGKLIDGEDVLDAISNVKVKINPVTGEQPATYPVDPVVITSIYRAD